MKEECHWMDFFALRVEYKPNNIIAVFVLEWFFKEAFDI